MVAAVAQTAQMVSSAVMLEIAQALDVRQLNWEGYVPPALMVYPTKRKLMSIAAGRAKHCAPTESAVAMETIARAVGVALIIDVYPAAMVFQTKQRRMLIAVAFVPLRASMD